MDRVRMEIEKKKLSKNNLVYALVTRRFFKAELLKTKFNGMNPREETLYFSSCRAGKALVS